MPHAEQQSGIEHISRKTRNVDTLDIADTVQGPAREFFPVGSLCGKNYFPILQNERIEKNKMTKNVTAKATKAAKGTGSAVTTKRGRKAKAPDRKAVTVTLERRDADVLIAFLSGDTNARNELAISPEPAEPTEPGENGTPDEWRAYAQAWRNRESVLDAWRVSNSRVLRIRNRFSEGVAKMLAKADTKAAAK
jgi:hypothetical protein